MRSDMRHRISILAPVEIKGKTGKIQEFQKIFSNIWASKEPLLGNEFHVANQTQSKVEVKFRTYYFDGVENEMRIENGNDVFEILSAINVKSLDRELLMYCRKVKK
ncbi:phage head closure protein [Micromonospora provocatoris]